MSRSQLVTAGCLLVLAACNGSSAPNMDNGSGGGSGLPVGLAYAGSFHPVVHDGKGMAEAYVAQDASIELRFTSDFATADGPKLEVWLVRADDAQDSETVLHSEHVSLGALQSPTGAQSYAVPGNVNLGVYRSVTVWCVTFEVNFTTASLVMQ